MRPKASAAARPGAASGSRRPQRGARRSDAASEAPCGAGSAAAAWPSQQRRPQAGLRHASGRPQRSQGPGVPLVRRNPVVVGLLSAFTLGLYMLYWSDRTLRATTRAAGKRRHPDLWSAALAAFLLGGLATLHRSGWRRLPAARVVAR
ncbi:MAG TPA: hypothetical protein VFH47_06360, partial [Candidatus Thermoplasmatota archaeon]|nr:hypothetical protein [Candidatus Thermoplasmatota archaeon]